MADTSPGRLARVSASVIAFVAVASGGVLVLLFFAGQLLMRLRMDALSLPLLALVAAVAATFNPCAWPALPAFFALGGNAAEGGLRRRPGLAVAMALGSMSVVVVFGGVVAWLGMQAQMLVAVHFGWVQIEAGVVLVALAVVHLLGLAGRLPLMSQITGLGARVWDRAVGRPNAGGAYLFGAGFVAVGGT